MASSLKLSVRRREPRLISPANPTPCEFKILSDIDDQGSLRHQTPIVQFYGRDAVMGGRDPASVVSEALARVLVFYYPFAGRIRERSEGKLVVETTGEGVLFIEGDADVSLEQFGELQPPCPCLEELLYDVPGSADIVGGPLLLIQVTRLTCGGFVFALRMNHVISDGAGIGQFMNALGELARGAATPSILPVWQRDLLTARHPPRPIFPHPEYVEGTVAAMSGDKIERCFFFGAKEMQALRSQLPPHLLDCSRYELLAACLWRARTAALTLPPELEVKLLCVVNARNRYSPPLPAGYYGNAIGLPTAISTAGELSQTPLAKVVEMVRETVAKVDDEYMRSVADELVAKGRPKAATLGAYHISDLTGHGFEKVDFGWGRPVYGGIARVGVDPGVASFHISCRRKGEEGVMVPTCLPERAMGRFLEELRIQTSGLIGA